MADLDFYYPFDSVNSDRKTTAATERAFFNALYTSGVVGANAFNLSTTGAGVYSIGAGVAVIGGAIGGIKSAKSITAQPAQNTKTYIVLRLDTTSSVRKITLEVEATPKTATAAQLDAGAQHDLILYSVENSGGSYGVLDLRTYCNSFDNEVFAGLFDTALNAMLADGNTQLDALTGQMQEAINEANAQTSGLYGGMARQGFINPTFQVNQRGLSRYGLSSGAAYTFDRWLARIGGASTIDNVAITRIQDAARLAMRITNKPYSVGDTAAASCICQNILGGVRQFCAGNKRFTVSFDAKASTVQRLAVEPVQFLAAGSGSGTAITAQIVTLTTSWQRFSLTFEGSVTPNENQLEDVLKVAFFFAWRGYSDRFGTDQNAATAVYLANMQINEGAASLPCYVKPMYDDKADCMRFYQKHGAITLSCGSKVTNNRRVISSPMPLQVEMRAKPAVTAFDRTGAQGYASVEDLTGAFRGGLAFAVSSESNINPVFAVTDTVAGELSRVVFSRVDLDAELLD